MYVNSVTICSHELEVQAEEFEAMYGQRFKNLQKSMKKQYSRKRKRPNDG